MKSVYLYGGSLAATLLSGCVTPMMNPQETKFTSTPSGAEVVYEGKSLGTTPMTYPMRDEFGLFSTYEIQMKKPGYQDQSVAYREKTFFHAQGAVPTEVHMDLAPKPQVQVQVQAPTTQTP